MLMKKNDFNDVLGLEKIKWAQNVSSVRKLKGHGLVSCFCARKLSQSRYSYPIFFRLLCSIHGIS